ncbi:metallophosphoesterase family protein [Haloarchaeobius amylolyticus]|uniref:metallophosphoesterase family protein n=1 Tax=Haloarchaeobius amylolyticus TaxID=1198296 RepID=UPI00226FE7E6|nr:metallophosphoesterase [Haloarchaeobius amylolyticus]
MDADDGTSTVGGRNPGFAAAATTDWLAGDGSGPSGFAAGDSFADVPLRRDGPALLARFAEPATTEPASIAVVSDVHLSTRETGSWKVFHRTETLLRRAVADLNDHDVDLVVFTGDLTENGATADFELVSDVLGELDHEFVAVPGNHDVPKTFDEHAVPPLSRFEREYTPGGFPFTVEAGGVSILGLNTAHAPDGSLDDTHEGTVSPDQRAWLADELPRHDAPLVVGHHNLPGLLDATGGHSWRGSFPMRDPGPFADVLAGGGAPLYLSGHLHVPAVAATAGVRELVSPAVCSFPQAYLVLEVGPAGTSVWHVPVATRADATEALDLAHAYSERSRMVAGIVRRQTGAYPLVDELAPADEPGSPAATGECD